MKEPPRPMGWEHNTTIRQNSNTTPGNRQNKQQTSTKHKQELKNGPECQQENTGIQQKQNDKTISHSTIGKPVTSNIQSSDSDNDSDSEDESLTTPNLVDHEVSNKYKTSINSNLTDGVING